MFRYILLSLLLICLAYPVFADNLMGIDSDQIYRLSDGQTKQANALWVENPTEKKFGDGRSKVVIADLKGPGIVTMIHFALPGKLFITRDVLLRIYWDGEKNPSVEAPLADFFCDPNGALERVDSILVNKKRGWNCYFPMPFRKSARFEVIMESKRYPNSDPGSAPCYSYVHYRSVKSIPADAGYFHACWRQQTLLLGKEDYKVFEAKGKGQFIGWNMTIHAPGQPLYPVDENVNFYIDGEKEPSIEWQGLEDSFGFSWNFPEQANSFPYTGYQPYYNGAAAYRFNLSERIAFNKSMRMTVGFGKNESPYFTTTYSQPENSLELSSVAYWYQKEPHSQFPPILPSDKRGPTLISTPISKYVDAGETLVINCGRRMDEIEHLDDGWDFQFKRGYSYAGWSTEISHCWADNDSLDFDLICPKGAAGMLKLFILDSDNHCGGRKESVNVAGKLVGEYENFQSGRWIEIPISAADTAYGSIPVAIKNTKPGANAVISLIRFVRAKLSKSSG